MSAAGIRAGRAYVELGTDDSKLVAGLKGAQAKLKSFGADVVKVGAGLSAASAAILGPMVAAVAHFAAAGDELTKLSNKTGASVESLSELRHAASQSAVDFQQLTGALAKQQKVIGEAANGSSSAQAKLASLGLTFQQLQVMTPDKQFEAIAQAISQIQDPAQRTTAAMEIFGKSGAELMPLMLNGAQGIQELRKEAIALGLQVSTSDANAATLLGDTWANVVEVLKQAAFQIGAALAPTLISLLTNITPVIVAAVNFIKENQTLIMVVAAVGVGLGVLGVALVATGALISAGSVVMGVFAAATTAAGVAVQFLLSPITLIVAAVAAIIVGIGALIVLFTDFGQIVKSVFGGMWDAIAGGNWGLAVKIMWTGIKIAWTQGIGAIVVAWTKMKLGIAAIFDDMFTTLRNNWNTFKTWLVKAILWAVDKLNSVSEAVLGYKVVPIDSSALMAEIDKQTAEFNQQLDQQNKERDDERKRIVRETERRWSTGKLKKELDDLNAQAKRERDQKPAAIPGPVAGPAVPAAPTATMGPANGPKPWTGGVVRADGMPQRPDLGDLSDITPKALPTGTKGEGGTFLTRSLEMAVSNAIKAADSGVLDAKKTAETAGTFSAMAAAMWGTASGDPVQNEQLAMQKKIEKNTRNGNVQRVT